MKINLGVIYGGNSTEHEISIISAVQAMNHLDKEKYEIVPIYVSKDNKFYTNSNLMDISTYKDLKKLAVNATEVIFSHKNNENVLIKNKFPYGIVAKIDLILPIMHGYNTEDGSYAGFFEVLGIPFCQSDLYSSCIGQDKVFQKQICIHKTTGLPLLADFPFCISIIKMRCNILVTELSQSCKTLDNKIELS